MPAAGTTKISNQTRAKILAEKRVGMGTNRDIAKRHGVAVQTVRNLGSADRPLAADVLVLAKTFQKRILEQAANNVENGLVEIGRRIVDPNERFSAIIQAARFSYEVYRSASALRDPVDERVAEILDAIRRRAAERGISFESELADYLTHFSHSVTAEVRTRIEMIAASSKGFANSY